MPLLTAHERPPKFWAIQATLTNLPYLENLFRDGEIAVTSDKTYSRMYSVKLKGSEKDDYLLVTVAEGDYFVWEHGLVRESLVSFTKPQFEERFVVDETLDTGLG